MSNAAWPFSLPERPLAQGFSERAPYTALRTETEAGPAKVRRRFTAGIRTMDMQLRLTPDQVATLDAFYDSTLASGTLQFDWVHPRSGAALSYRFVEPPSYQPVARGRLWTATLKLEVLRAERPGDGILMRMMGHPIHVAVVVSRGWMLHIEQDIDACLERYDHIKWRRRVIGFYRHAG